MKKLDLPFPSPLQWKKLGRILTPQQDVSWLSTYAGPSFAKQVNGSVFDLFVTGRDHLNRSQIGKVRVDLKFPEKIISISPEPIFSFGDPGAFDENGVSYPYLIEDGKTIYMYYVGWMPTVLTPFQNHIGLARQNDDGTFRRVSRAPILDRTDSDYLSMGSSCVLKDQDKFRMWYTSFLRWGKPGEHKHYYVIKYAESDDAIHWQRENHICIDILYDWEFSICRPTVLKTEKGYHMWFSSRGEHYRIGYAYSNDGLNWTRRDDLAGIGSSASGWDSKAQAYPHVFEYEGSLFMIYNGNDYGREGLGLARLEQ